MTDHERESDDRLDELLADLGPDVPRPELPGPQRDRLLAMITGVPSAARPRPARARWRAAAGLILVVSLGIATLHMGLRLRDASAALSRSQWESGEALELLVRARYAHPTVATSDEMEGIAPEDLVLVTFDHELCPIARFTTPAFDTLASEHAGDVRFITLDVTGSSREGSRARVDDLGLGYALLTPLGGETGTVKVIDVARQRVLCSAPGHRGLDQARMVLARVTSGRGVR